MKLLFFIFIFLIDGFGMISDDDSEWDPERPWFEGGGRHSL